MRYYLFHIHNTPKSVFTALDYLHTAASYNYIENTLRKIDHLTIGIITSILNILSIKDTITDVE